MSRQLALRLLALAALALMFIGSWWLAGHFPQTYAHRFYIGKAVVGCLAVVVTVIHMDRTWDRLDSGAQMARYLVLLFGTVIAGAGSFEQIRDHALVEWRNIGGALFLLAVLVVMVYSLREEWRHPTGTTPAAQNRP